MESQALFTATITTYCGLYYLTPGLSEIFQTVLFGVILASNGYLVLFWLYYMGQSLIDLIAKVFPKFRSYLLKGDAFDSGFLSEKLQRKGVFMNKLEGEVNYTFFEMKDNKHQFTVKGESLPDLFESVFLAENGIDESDNEIQVNNTIEEESQAKNTIEVEMQANNTIEEESQVNNTIEDSVWIN